MDQSEIWARNARFVERRDIAVDIMRTSPVLDVHVPAGAFYLFPRILAAGSDDDLIATRLAERARVLVTNGTSFGAPGHFRMSFALEPEVLAEGCRRIVAALHELDTERNSS
jgi:aspartate aminotransferase